MTAMTAGVDGFGGGRSGGADPDAAGGVVVQQRGGHLGAAGVVDADEQHLGKVGLSGHEGSLNAGGGP
jgi:hypothetical protein